MRIMLVTSSGGLPLRPEAHLGREEAHNDSQEAEAQASLLQDLQTWEEGA